MSLVGILSDTHDHLDRTRAAVALFNSAGADLVVHCGDYVSQFTVRELSGLDAKLVGVFGNNDGDRAALRQRADEAGFELHAGLHRFEFAGRSFAASHEPVTPPECDFYLHGHTHRRKLAGREPLVINPGEACGWLTGAGSVALLDTESGKVDFKEL